MRGRRKHSGVRGREGQEGEGRRGDRKKMRETIRKRGMSGERKESDQERVDMIKT